MEPADSTPWVFPGWGRAEKITDLALSPPTPDPSGIAPQNKLGVWRATAICGNDITSSVLYVAAICTTVAGVYAPVALVTVGLVLFLFRKIYAEAGTALPLNGGAYNVLLNTTSKAKASIAACLTLLSYVATAVISSNEAIHYAHQIAERTPIVAGTVALISFLALGMLPNSAAASSTCLTTNTRRISKSCTCTMTSRTSHRV